MLYNNDIIHMEILVMAKRKKQSKFEAFFSNTTAVTIIAIIILIALFVGTFFITTTIFKGVNKANENETEINSAPVNSVPVITSTTDNAEKETTSVSEKTTILTAPSTRKPVVSDNENDKGNIVYPSDTASWQMICLNRNRCVGASVENTISLSYVAGSGELMDSRAAAAYEKMYDAAADDGIYLTPCSGYRSYSTQKRLYNEFFYEYLDQGYSEKEAHDLTSRRRNPPGSSEHNIGICMDIICASSSANFQNTEEYDWLQNNAHNYGFILRYPADKVDITGVKFEPWHWRYVGVENAAKIKNSGKCLEEYLGLA